MRMKPDVKKRLKQAGMKTERGTCECGHNWWDHAFATVYPCQARGCMCRKFVREEPVEGP